MHHFGRLPPAAQAALDLHHAARVAGRDDVRVGGAEGLELSRQHRARHLAVGQVVDPRRAAAAGRVVVLEQRQAGDLPQQQVLF